ncbi:MAG: phytanoyl-CoA dioxygenase family protein [Chloroflexi bacterium]|nr:phytanoyl-CoA dioxygenase family protein [Chloroflexota bacterium]
MITIDDQAALSGVDEDFTTLYRDGTVGRKGVFARDWVERLHDDMLTAFWAAIQRPRGTVARGRRRWYVEVHPEQISGFVDLISQPWIGTLSEQVLGPEYRFVEIGFDVPFQGATDQPWHRDFASPPETYRDHRLTSLAFNVTGVDVAPDMGPFEIAPGTQWEEGRDWDHGMFPPKAEWPRFAELGVRKYPQMGDVSARTALTVHRGTLHASPIARPVLILGVVAGAYVNPDEHDLRLTPAFADSLRPEIRDRLLYRTEDELVPIVQRHDIEGLVMGAD